MSATTTPANTLLLGLIGQSIQGSCSPQLHEEEARQLGLRCLYQLHDLPLDTSAAQLDALLAAMQAVGYAGCNITHPFKQTVMACLDSLSDDAAAIGAVNTVLLRAANASATTPTGGALPSPSSSNGRKPRWPRWCNWVPVGPVLRWRMPSSPWVASN
jgi:shikimate 5-dehydrogenase